MATPRWSRALALAWRLRMALVEHAALCRLVAGGKAHALHEIAKAAKLLANAPTRTYTDTLLLARIQHKTTLKTPYIQIVINHTIKFSTNIQNRSNSNVYLLIKHYHSL